jgi:hypothetical protein
MWREHGSALAPPLSCESKPFARTILRQGIRLAVSSLGRANGALMSGWGHPFGGREPDRRRQAAGFRLLIARWLATLIVLFPIVLSAAYQSRPTGPVPDGDLARFLSTFGSAASICWTMERPTQPAPATPQQDWPATDGALCPVCQLLQQVVGCPPPLVALLISPEWVAAPLQRSQVASLPWSVSAFLPAVRAPPHSTSFLISQKNS